MARDAYKGLQMRAFHPIYITHTHTHTHTHTYNKYMPYWGLAGGKDKERNDKSVCRREEVGFQF